MNWGDQTVLGWPEEVGLTAYPYTGKAPNDPQSVYSTTVYFGYDLSNPEYFDENGTCKFWYDLLKEFENGATVSDIKVNGFVSVLPAMSSSYMITKTKKCHLSFQDKIRGKLQGSVCIHH